MTWPETKTTIIRDTAALEALRPEWEALFARCPAATPFQSPAWLVPWWRHYGPGELLVVALRAKARLVGLLPAYLSREPDDGIVRLIGCGNSDYLDALIEPESDAASLLAALGEAPEWRGIDLTGLPAASPLKAAPLPAGWHAELQEEETCPVLALAPEDGIPRKMLRNLRNDRNRLARLGAASIETADAASLDRLFGALVRLHEARWRTRGEPGVIAAPRDRAFHREAAGALLAAGMLRLHAVVLAGEVVGAYHGFARGGDGFAYLGGFDPALARVSLGTVLIGHVVEEIAREGGRCLHLLRGREPYKYEWGAVDRPTWRRLIRR